MLARQFTKFLFIIFSFALLSSCQKGGLKNDSQIKPPKGYEPAAAEALMSAGENYQGQFSNDGTKVLFISRDRVRHSQAQVYELDLKLKTDRRITFSDGDVFDANYTREPNEIIYSSTTDEIKENPEFIRLAIEKNKSPLSRNAEITNFYGQILPATEIYLSTLDGRKITRLTETKGFDGQISTSRSRPEIAFISVRKNKREIYILNPTSMGLTLVATGKDESDSAQLSASGKNLLWTRGSFEIWISDTYGSKAKKIIGDQNTNIDARWGINDEDIIFSSNRDDKENFELYVAKLDGSCVRRLTYNSAHDRSPSLSPDGKKLLFSSNRSGKWQIYLADYSPPPCPQIADSLQSK